MAEPRADTRALEAETARALRGLFGRDTLYVVIWAVQVVVAALCIPILTRLLGPYRYGMVASSIAVMQVLVALGGAGLQTAVQWQFARSGERDARRLITLAMVVSALAFLVANATGPWWCARLGLGAYGGAVRYAVIWAAFTAVSNSALGLMRSRDQLRAFALVGLLQSVVAELLGLVLVLLVARTATEFVFGQAIVQAATVVVALVVARPAAVRGRDAGMLAAALRYSLALVPAALATFSLQAADRLIVQHDLGSAAVARYSVANNIGVLPILLLGVLSAMWLPRIFTVAGDGLRRTVLARSRDALYRLLVPVVVGVGVGAPIALRIWAPASYRPDELQLVVALVAIASIPVAGLLAAQRTLLSSGRTLAVGALTVAAGAANIALNIALVPVLGIEGSALGVLLSYALLHGLLAVAAGRVERVSWPRAAVVAELVAAGAVALAATRLPTDPALLGLRLVVALGCLALVVVMLRRLVRPDDRLAGAAGDAAGAGVAAGPRTSAGAVS
ncbi:MAG TPA: lipopolysaccharide biosynthesis protein [Thermoleophilia bacterium]|nr:lipopolysaccharide biosynthesis protein [Thermoleophilia bacterium]